MKKYIYFIFMSVLSFPVIAQDLSSDIPTEAVVANQASVPVVEVPIANNETDAAPSVFDNMMDTLFGQSSLPTPEGSITGEVSEPAPLFSNVSDVPAADAAAMPMAEPVMVPPPAMMAAPVPVQPIMPAPAAPRPVISNFDIAGIKLKMSPKEVFEQAVKHGYKPEYVDKTSANFVKWRFERQCMDEGVYVYERKQECIKENAKKTGDYYINYMEFTKDDSKEKLRAFFTSSFSGNKLYRVTYYNEGDNSLGDTTASIYIKDKRKSEFYNWLTKKYGQPTNPSAMVWGDGGDAPYFQAFTSGSSVNFNLTLEAPIMPYEDSQAMKKADVKSVTYSEFSF